jgi:hypothetical protein
LSNKGWKMAMFFLLSFKKEISKYYHSSGELPPLRFSIIILWKLEKRVQAHVNLCCYPRKINNLPTQNRLFPHVGQNTVGKDPKSRGLKNRGLLLIPRELFRNDIYSVWLVFSWYFCFWNISFLVSLSRLSNWKIANLTDYC